MMPGKRKPRGLRRFLRRPSQTAATASEFLSDADEIEQRPLPRRLGSTLHIMVAAIVFAVLWASLAEIERIVVAEGKLLTVSNTIVVQPLEIAVIRSIDVKVGQVVKKGARLGALDSTFTAAEVSQLRSRLLSTKAQIARIEAELNGTAFEPDPSIAEAELQARLFAERRGHFKARILQYESLLARIDAGVAGNDHDIKILRERLDSIRAIEAMRQELFLKDAGSKLRVLETKDQRLSVDKDLQTATSRSIDLVKQHHSTVTERDALVLQWRQELAEELVNAQRDADSLKEQIAKAERKQELVDLTAPADAVVLEVARRSVGSVVKEAEPLFTLVPLDSPLEAEVRILSRDIGFVRTGDLAHIKLDAFPYQRHGTLEGQLRVVSEDAFTPQPGERPNDPRGGEPYYVARIDLKTFKLDKVPDSTRLLPGMSVISEIVVGHRSVISYLLYPLIRAIDESIREP